MKQNGGITNTKSWNKNKYFPWSSTASRDTFRRLAVSFLPADSIKQEIKCYSCQLFQFPLKKNQIFGLPIDKVENFSKKTKQSWIWFHFNMIKLWQSKNVYNQVL